MNDYLIWKVYSVIKANGREVGKLNFRTAKYAKSQPPTPGYTCPGKP